MYSCDIIFLIKSHIVFRVTEVEEGSWMNGEEN
jgi:hypothetical protein